MNFEKEKKECRERVGNQVPSYHAKPRIIRNIALLAVMEKDETAWKSVVKFQHHFFVEMHDEEDIPEMSYFRRMPFYLPPRNRFVQLLHNVIAYQGLPWFNKFLQDDASSVDGTYYMAAGVGPVSVMEINMSKWGWKLNPTRLLKSACDGMATPDVCMFLISKGATITDSMKDALAEKEDLEPHLKLCEEWCATYATIEKEIETLKKSM